MDTPFFKGLQEWVNPFFENAGICQSKKQTMLYMYTSFHKPFCTLGMSALPRKLITVYNLRAF